MFGKIFRKILLSLIAIIVVFVGTLFAYVQLNKSPQIFEKSVAGMYSTNEIVADPDSKVVSSSGELVGFSDSYDTFAWIGIPYAKPPVADLRWKAPRAADQWRGVKSATTYGSSCHQFWGGLAGVEGETGQVVGNEDCLYLNIWATKSALSDTKKRPVMVWIHGGGNDSGTGNIFQGHHLAGEKDVVVVTINYRLGLLGWLSHQSLKETSDNPADASGNYGTLDIIESLKWIQANIDSFGGDVNNVTLFGESAGGRNVYSMLASPLAKGLFHKAISQSGTPDTTLLTLAEEYPDTRKDAAVFGLRNSSNGLILNALNGSVSDQNLAKRRADLAQMNSVELVKKLKAMTPEKLMLIASENSTKKTYVKVARVLRDGYVLPKESTLSLFSDPAKYNSVPLLLGTNRDEQKLFMASNPRYVDFLFNVIPKPKDVTRYNRVSEYVSDNWKAGAVDEPAKLISQTSAPDVYAYRFDWDESASNWLVDLPTLIGAAHGVEINFVFGDFEGGVDISFLADKTNASGRAELSQAMMDYWTAFAHTGHPGKGLSGEQVHWNRWSGIGENIMVLDTQADGGRRMQELRHNVADIKSKLAQDTIITDQKDRCEAYAALFLHGYQSSDFWNENEYLQLGCEAYPARDFRDS